MAQGTLKSKKLTTATARTTRAAKTGIAKKGLRTVAPKNALLVRNAKMTKVGFSVYFCDLDGLEWVVDGLGMCEVSYCVVEEWRMVDGLGGDGEWMEGDCWNLGGV